MALGKLLEGAAWFATLSLATAGGLTFVPDGAWETFPTALRPARAKLAEFGVAPTRYRADFDASNGDGRTELATNRSAAQDASNGKVDKTGKTGEVDVWTVEVRIGERWKKVQKVEETAFVDNRSENAALERETEGRTLQTSTAEPATLAGIPGTESVEATDGADWGEGTTAEIAPFENPIADEDWDVNAIPPFVEETGVPADAEGGALAAANVENETTFPGFENVEAQGEIGGGVAGGGVLNEENAGIDVGASVASVAEPINANDYNDYNGGSELAASSGAAPGLLEQADAALANESNVEPSVASPAPVVDEAVELRNALAAVAVASTPEEIKTVFETLNRIRNERGGRLAVADSQALDAALDRLAFDVFYNPAQTILEPRWQTAPGESLASIAERLGTTPETLAEINGIKSPVDAPLPVGTTLKTVRGPVSAEISIAKKELTLRFNGLYAGRFALGVPESSANLRGVFRVVEKLANPNCDAVDANGRTISIPGGAPENPLGSAWIALDGGAGLQGTNRPELVGQTIPENGGFVFSNREIAQLSVLLPVGATVAIVD